jgi:hypothetical protein
MSITKAWPFPFVSIMLELPPRQGGVRLRAPTPWRWGPWGVAVPRDSLQVKNGF